jgi:hypothetical protein
VREAVMWSCGGPVPRGGAGVEAAVVLAVAFMAPMTRTESKGPYSMVSGPAHRHRLHRHRLRAAWAKRESAGVTAAGSS